jgi:hypothetical protein
VKLFLREPFGGIAFQQPATLAQDGNLRKIESDSNLRLNAATGNLFIKIPILAYRVFILQVESALSGQGS